MKSAVGSRFLVFTCALIAPSTLYAYQGPLGGQSVTSAWAAASDAAVFGEKLPELAGAPTLLAQAQQETGAEEPQSEECLKFAQDINADVGEIIRAGCKPTTAQMAKLMDNPLGSVAMWFNQFDLYRMTNESVTSEEKNKGNFMWLFQFPKRLSDRWNLINRVVLNVSSMPLDQDKIDDANAQAGEYSDITGVAQPPAEGPALPINLFDGRTTGVGDMYYVGLFSPSDPIVYKEGGPTGGRAIGVWGLGFDLGAPTASEDLLGTGKWTAGPSALYAYMGPRWKLGGLLQQYWDFAGDDDRDPVNLTNFQYFLFYSIDETLSVGAAPNIIGNWELDSDDRWTVPIGFGVQKVIKLGKASARIGVELHYSVVQPDNVPSSEWNFRAYFIPAAPSALFKWMQ